MSALLTPTLAAAHIARGQLIAYPTEAVYGIGCNPQNIEAVQAVLNLKSRDANKGFIIIAASIEQLSDYMQSPSESELQRLNESWPGPVTYVVPVKPGLSPILTGGRNTLAVRVSAHPVVQALCDACGHALISTSANFSGQDALLSAGSVQDAFGRKIAGVVEGDLGTLATATPIYSLKTGEKLR